MEKLHLPFSSANKISSFLGAQWIVVKVGKIIFLYQIDEVVSFPLVLEQVQAEFDAKTPRWSALVNN